MQMSCAESSTDDSVADTHSSHDDTKSDTTSNTQNDWQSNASGDNLLRTPQSNYPDKQSAETADRDASVIQVSPISNTLLCVPMVQCVILNNHSTDLMHRIWIKCVIWLMWVSCKWSSTVTICTTRTDYWWLHHVLLISHPVDSSDLHQHRRLWRPQAFIRVGRVSRPVVSTTNIPWRISIATAWINYHYHFCRPQTIDVCQ